MILVTGATGGLGALIVERLAEQSTLIAGTRTPHLVPTGTSAATVDFDHPDTLPSAFTGVETLLLISAGYGEDDVVIARHAAAIDAAEQAGVAHIVYTSLTGAGDHLTFALAHRWTERRLRNGSTPWTILRNGLYAELLGSLATPDTEGLSDALWVDLRRDRCV